MATGLVPGTAATNSLLEKQAHGDFGHDFDDIVRASITIGILNQIQITNTKTLKTSYKTLLDLIQKSNPGQNTTTAFRLFKDKFSNTLPPSSSGTDFSIVKPLHEDQVTNLVNIPYTQLLQSLVAPRQGSIPEVIRTPGYMLAGRPYEVVAVAEKFRSDHYHMVSCLHSLTQVQTFVIMWDAGSCEISEIGSAFTNLTQGFDPNKLYNVYFINSKENLSDPAPKPTIDTLNTRNPNVNIYFLEEQYPDAATTYPVYPGNGNDQNANLFSGYQLVTKRGEGKKVNGTLFGGDVTISTNDIKESSKVSNAVASAVSALLTDKNVYEQMSYFFLKRAGDWCQALTLLDKVRTYTSTPSKGNNAQSIPTRNLTLATLEGEGARVLLITNDRVLLSYAVGLGLDIVFTNMRNGINWLLYFKNKLAGKTDDKDKVISISKGYFGEAGKPIQDLITNIETTINEASTLVTAFLYRLSNPETISNARDFANTLMGIRQQTYIVARLPSIKELKSLNENMILATKEAESPKVGDKLSVYLGTLRSGNGSFDSAKSLYEALTKTPFSTALSEQDQLVKLFTKVLTPGGVVTPTSDEFAQYQTIIDSIKSDSEKIVPKQYFPALPTDADVRAKMSGIGVILGITRGSRVTPEFSSLGLIYDYFNRNLTEPLKTGGRKKFKLRGGSKFRDKIEQEILSPILRNARRIISYGKSEADSAYQIDKENFIGKIGDKLQNIDGEHFTILDGFAVLQMGSFDFKNLRDILVEKSQNERGQPNELFIFTEEPISMFPYLYILYRDLLEYLDLIDDELIGLQSQDFSSPENLVRVDSIQDDLARLGKITRILQPSEVEDGVPVEKLIESVISTHDEWLGNLGRQFEPSSADAILDRYYSLINQQSTEGVYPNQEQIQRIISSRNDSRQIEPDQWPLIYETEGPQYIYDYYINRQRQVVQDNIDRIILTFEERLIVGTGTLQQYSKYMEGGIDGSVNVPIVLKSVDPTTDPAEVGENEISYAAKTALLKNMIGDTEMEVETDDLPGPLKRNTEMDVELGGGRRPLYSPRHNMKKRTKTRRNRKSKRTSRTR